MHKVNKAPILEFKNPPLVGFVGQKRSGKSTAAGAVGDITHSRRISFAAPIKEMVACVLRSLVGQDQCVTKLDKYLNGEHKEAPIEVLKSEPTPRDMMQTLGTEWGREMVDESIWIMIAMMKADSARAEGFTAVIDDVRFPNEAEAIRNAGGTLVGIHRPALPSLTDMHASETSMQGIECDHSILNAGGVDDLRNDVYGIITDLRAKEKAQS